MTKITFGKNDQVTVTFVHKRTKEQAKVFIARNPLTNSWLQEHTVGEQSTPYMSNKASCVSLVNSIVKKNTELGLPVDVKIEPRKTIPK